MSAFLRKYNTATHVYVPIIKRAVVDFAVGADWTPQAGDVKVSIDGAAVANIGTLPVAIAAGNGAFWDYTVAAGEVLGKKITVTSVDAATKAIEDQCFVIETYGNASAEHPFDLGTASSAQTGDSFARIGVAGAGLTNIDLPNQTMDIVGNITGNLSGSVGSVTAGVTLAAAAVQAIWDALTSALTTAGSIGKYIVDNLTVGGIAAIKAKTDSLAFTSAGKVDANELAINGDATAAANLAKTTRAIARCTVTAAASSTSIPTSACTPSGGAADQFKGKTITFDADTTTAALRSQSTDITASTNAAAPTFTVTALTTAPASGDTFSIT